jgi:hypothetical protein
MMGRAGDRSTVCRLFALGLVVFLLSTVRASTWIAARTRPCFVIRYRVSSIGPGTRSERTL